jgi:hypothetical protein
VAVAGGSWPGSWHVWEKLAKMADEGAAKMAQQCQHGGIGVAAQWRNKMANVEEMWR